MQGGPEENGTRKRDGEPSGALGRRTPRRCLDSSRLARWCMGAGRPLQLAGGAAAVRGARPTHSPPGGRPVRPLLSSATQKGPGTAGSGAVESGLEGGSRDPEIPRPGTPQAPEVPHPHPEPFGAAPGTPKIATSACALWVLQFVAALGDLEEGG